MLPKINSAHGSDTRNIINRAIEALNRLGIDVQTLVAEGQLTEAQYAQLVTIINSNLKSGDVDFLDFNDSTKNRINEIDKTLSDVIKGLNGTEDFYTPIGLENYMTTQNQEWVI